MAPKQVSPRKLKGFQDYHPETMAMRYGIMDAVRKVARENGFQPVGTPAIEYSEVLLGQGAETDKQIYRFEDNGGRDIGLRFDLTVPFARYVAEHQGTMVFPFKRLQIGDVWRAEKPQKGRFREFCQCDLDIIGVDSMAADADILISLQQVFEILGVGAVTQWVGHRGVLSALLRRFLGELEVSDEGQVLIALDKLNKIGKDAVVALIVELLGQRGGAAADLIDVLTPPRSTGNAEEGGDEGGSEGAQEKAESEYFARVTEALRGDGSESEEVPGLKDLERLRRTVQLVRAAASGGDANANKNARLARIAVDLRIARGLGYYTGIVFETLLDAFPEIGAVSSGGRYNNLTERFSKRPYPGVGGAVGLDRLVAAIHASEELTLKSEDARVSFFVAIASDDATDYGFEIAAAIRAAGFPADVSVKPGKIGPQFKFAANRGHGMTITVGAREKEARTYSLKVEATGEERRDLPFAEIAEEALRV